MKKYLVLLTIFLLSTVSVFALSEAALGKPGITPDSPFYFVDRMFDVFQSVESRVNERAAEAIVMAQEGHEKGLAKALEGYNNAMTKREQKAEKDEDSAEDVVRQAADHLEILAGVREKVPEAGKSGIDQALIRSAQAFDKSLDSLEEKNAERAGVVAKETLERVLANTPEEAQASLQKALEAVQRQGAPEDLGKPAN